MKKISVLLVVGFLGAALVLPMAPAKAHFSGSFQCAVIYYGWPTTTQPTSCTGSATGFMTNPTEVCAPLCSFELTIDSSNETCVGFLLPALGIFAGTMSVNDNDQAAYDALRVGTEVLFLPLAPATVSGIAEWIPQPPLPTCAASGALRASMAGSVES